MKITKEQYADFEARLRDYELRLDAHLRQNGMCKTCSHQLNTEKKETK